MCDKIAADYVRNDLAFPEVRQAGYIRKSVYKDGKLQHEEDWYGITSCSRLELLPECFLDVARKHWEVENGLHHVKDRSWLEDHQYTKDRALGGVLGVIRNLSLNVMRSISPPSKSREKRKYDVSLPRQALAHLMNPQHTLMKIFKI